MKSRSSISGIIGDHPSHSAVPVADVDTATPDWSTDIISHLSQRWRTPPSWRVPGGVLIRGDLGTARQFYRKNILGPREPWNGGVTEGLDTFL